MHQYGTRRYSHQSSPVASASSRLSAGPSSSINISRSSRRSPAIGSSGIGERRLSHSNDSYSGFGSSTSSLLKTTGALSGSDYLLRPSRYDSYYSRNSKDFLTNGSAASTTTTTPATSASRYLSPNTNTRYLPSNTNVSSRDSSFSSSWPSPVRKDSLLSSALDYHHGSPGRWDYTSVKSNYSSNPSISGSTTGVFHRAYDSDKTVLSTRAETPSRRNSSSYNNYLDPVSATGRTLSNGYDRGRRLSGAGTYRDSIGTTSSTGLNSHSRMANGGYVGRGLVDTGTTGRLSLSRSSSRTSFSPNPNPPTSSQLKTSWSKHYSSISSQWAENSGSKITNKTPYNYRPTISTQYGTNVTPITAPIKQPYSSKYKTRSKDNESDGYDSSSSNDDGSKSTDVTQKSSVQKTKRRSHRKSKSQNPSTTNGASKVEQPGSKIGHNVKVQITRDDKKKSSSDEEPSSFYDSLDTRLKARRRRLQRSKNMLQEQKEDSWIHRRALQMEDTKHRTFEHLLNPMTEYQRRQERKNSKPTSVEESLTQKANDISMPMGVDDHSSEIPSGSSFKKISTPNIQPLPARPTSWRGASIKSSVSPAKSSVSPERTQIQLTKINTTDQQHHQETLGQNAITKRTDFNYNEYVSSIAPKKETPMYDSPSLLLLETDQELFKKAVESKINEEKQQPKVTLDFRKSSSPKQNNGKIDWKKDEISLTTKVEAENIKPVSDIREINGQSETRTDGKNPEIIIEKPSPVDKLLIKEPEKEKVNDNKSLDEKISTLSEQLDLKLKSVSPPPQLKKESENSIVDINFSTKSNKIPIKLEPNEQRSAIIQQAKSGDELNKNIEKPANVVKSDEKLEAAANKTQFPVAKPRKSLQQTKIKLLSDSPLSPTLAVHSDGKSVPIENGLPTIDTTPRILGEVKIETIPILNTSVLETKKSPLSPKISVTTAAEKKKLQEVEPPKMSVVVFERQINFSDQSKLSAKKDQSPLSPKKVQTNDNVSKPELKSSIETKKNPITEQVTINTDLKNLSSKSSLKSPKSPASSSPKSPKSPSKPAVPEPVPEIIEETLLKPKKAVMYWAASNVSKQKMSELKQQKQAQTGGNEKSPEPQKDTKVPTVDKPGVPPLSTEQPKSILPPSNVLKINNKIQTIEPTVIKIHKQQPAETKTLIQARIPVVDKKDQLASEAAKQQYKMDSVTSNLAAHQLPHVEKSKSPENHVLDEENQKTVVKNRILDIKLQDSFAKLKPVETLTNGTADKSKEPSPIVNLSEAKITGQLVNHAPETKISVQVLNSIPDVKAAIEPVKALQQPPEQLKPIKLILQEAAKPLPPSTASTTLEDVNKQPLSEQLKNQSFTAAMQQFKQSKQENQPTSATKLLAQLKQIEEQEKIVQQAKLYNSFQDYKRQLPKTDPSVYELHRLPSVDREMLQLLTLGEELNASRTSLYTAESRTPSDIVQQSPKLEHQYAKKQEINSAGNPHWKGSHDSLPSMKVNNVPKPWRSVAAPSSAFPPMREREGSMDSMASFATAATHVNGSKESLNTEQTKIEAFRHHGTFDVIRTGPSPSVVRNECNRDQKPNIYPVHNQPAISKVHNPTVYNNHPLPRRTSLDEASTKIEEMLKLAREKHQHDKPHFREAPDELDEVYEQIKQEYASEQQMRRNNRAAKHGPLNAKTMFKLETKPHDGAVLSTAQLMSPELKENNWMELNNKGSLNNLYKVENDDDKFASQQARDSSVKPNEEFTEYDQIKMDYTKRWLEGDLKSLTRDPKPDLLQFGSQSRIEADQRSIGSASAEVAAITNRDRLHALRVPDIVPQKPELVKPAPVFQQTKPFQATIAKQAQAFLTQQPLHPSYTMSEPSHYYPDKKGKYVLAEHVKIHDASPHMAKPFVRPKKEIGVVKKQVDMFDRMSDNESERSFLSDNLAYRSVLNRNGRKLSLTDHIAGFIRKFESDEALGMPQGNHKNIINENTHEYIKSPPRRMHGSSGSTHSLPIIQPVLPVFKHHPASTCQDNIPGQWQKMTASPWTNKFNQGKPQFLSVPASYNEQWSSNSTLTDLDICDNTFADALPSSKLPAGKPAYLSKNHLQNLDNIVAELTLHTDDRPQLPQYRFPVEPKTSPARQLPTTMEDGSNQALNNFQRRQMLNVIPEYNENYENIYYGQKKLEEARRDLKQSTATFVSNNAVSHIQQGGGYDQQQLRSGDNFMRPSPVRVDGSPVDHMNGGEVPPALPPRNQSSSFVLKPAGHAQAIKARHAQRTSWHEPPYSDRLLQQQRENDYDNVQQLRLLNAQNDQIPVSRVNNPSLVNLEKGGSNNYLENVNSDFTKSTATTGSMNNTTDPPTKNPIKNLFQMFNRTSKNEKPMPKEGALKGSTVSLNVVNAHSTKLPEKLHKSNSISEATKLKSSNGVELQQLDDLLISMQASKDSNSNVPDQTGAKDGDKQRKLKRGWSLWKR